MGSVVKIPQRVKNIRSRLVGRFAGAEEFFSALRPFASLQRQNPRPSARQLPLRTLRFPGRVPDIQIALPEASSYSTGDTTRACGTWVTDFFRAVNAV